MSLGFYPLVAAINRRRATRVTASMLAGEWARGVASSAARPLGFFPLPGAATGDRPVVLVHGYAMSRGYFWLLARRLARAGFGPIVGYEYWSLGSLAAAARGLGRSIDRLREQTGVERVDVVGHSMGGLVGRYHVAIDRGPGVRRLVTLGSPHAGSDMILLGVGYARRELQRGSAALARLGEAEIPADVAMTVVFSRGDMLCGAPDNGSVRGAETIEVDGVDHLQMLTSRRVADVVIDRLRS